MVSGSIGSQPHPLPYSSFDFICMKHPFGDHPSYTSSLPLLQYLQFYFASWQYLTLYMDALSLLSPSPIRMKLQRGKDSSPISLMAILSASRTHSCSERNCGIHSLICPFIHLLATSQLGLLHCRQS